jgi:hypothetical protein
MFHVEHRGLLRGCASKSHKYREIGGFACGKLCRLFARKSGREPRSSSRRSGEQQQAPLRPQELRGRAHECRVWLHSPDRDDVGCSSILRLVSERLESKILNLRVRNRQDANGFPQKRHLPGFGLDHREPRARPHKPERKRWRTPARPEIEPGDSLLRNESRGRHRLDQQPVERRVGRSAEGKRCQVDPFVPVGKEPEIRFQRSKQIGTDDKTDLSGAPGKSFPELAGGHVESLRHSQPASTDVFFESLPTNAPSTATAAGVTPGIRSA